MMMMTTMIMINNKEDTDLISDFNFKSGKSIGENNDENNKAGRPRILIREQTCPSHSASVSSTTTFHISKFFHFT